MKEFKWVVGSGGFIGEVSVRASTPAGVCAAVKGAAPLMALGELHVHPLRRGRGWAAELLRSVTAWADVDQVDLWLYASPYGVKTVGGKPVSRPTADQLVALYIRHGFVRLPALVDAAPWEEAGAGYEMEMVRRCRATK